MTAPAILRSWQQQAVAPIAAVIKPLYRQPPRIGVVVGTYAAVPYIHLQLEAQRRFYAHIPLLVHDDASRRGSELRELCDEYGVDFETNTTRQPPCLGDLTTFLGGLLWAKERSLDILLKVSRRWLFRCEWSASLAELAMMSQAATLGSYTTSFEFGFRTECLGLSVQAWTSPLVLAELQRTILRGESVFVEGYLHECARKLAAVGCPSALAYAAANPRPADRDGYALWSLMGIDRCQPSQDFLWHDSSGPSDYHRQAVHWGLSYSQADFEDPNQGEGDRPAVESEANGTPAAEMLR